MPQAVMHLEDHAPSRPGASMVGPVLLIVWFGLILWLGATETFVAKTGQPPLRLLVAVLGPVVAFLIAFRASPSVRERVLNADLRVLTVAQAWRFGGFAFLSLYTYGVLPAYFAWPAGLGDMAIGFTAPWMLMGLARTPEFVASRRFVTWNVLGILDLVVAVSFGAVVTLLFPGLGGGVTTTPMTRLPLVLIPGLFVPAFLILHVVALVQAAAARSRVSYESFL
jgi:hypothetical protein